MLRLGQSATHCRGQLQHLTPLLHELFHLFDIPVNVNDLTSHYLYLFNREHLLRQFTKKILFIKNVLQMALDVSKNPVVYLRFLHFFLLFFRKYNPSMENYMTKVMLTK